VPLIVTVTPPDVVPLVGESVVAVGSDEKVKLVVIVPPGVTTAMVTLPGARGGVTAVIWVAELTTKEVALTPPNVTAVVPMKLVPVIITDVPPAVVPETGESAVIDGAAAEYV
jgi:hypothetical protein